MAALAYIYQGFEEGSSLVKVRCFDTDGLTILLYLGYDLIGTQTLNDSEASFVLSQPLTKVPESLIAYVGEEGARTGGPQIIADSNKEATGWKTPETVSVNGVEQSYQAYLEDGNRELPDIYDPTQTKNRTPDSDSIQSFALKGINVDIVIDNIPGQSTVSITNVENAKGGFSIQFDGGIISNVSTKVYEASGEYEVKVIDNSASDNFKIIDYTLSIIPSEPPSSSSIEQVWCRIYYNTPQAGNLGQAAAYCPSQLQFKIDGILGSAWQDSISDGNDLWYYQFPFLGTGSKTLSARVKDNPTDIRTITFTV